MLDWRLEGGDNKTSPIGVLITEWNYLIIFNTYFLNNLAYNMLHLLVAFGGGWLGVGSGRRRVAVCV